MREYSFETKDGNTETISIVPTETDYLTLAQRYKELFTPGEPHDHEEEIPYEIDPHLTEINTGTIDRNYMESRFRKYLKELQDGVEATSALRELHKSFAVLSQEQQKYAKIFLTDVQQGNIVVSDSKTLIDYINQYQSDAQNDRIHKFASALGVDEELLRAFMNRSINENNINEFGLFDRLKATVDKEKAKVFFEKTEGVSVKPFRIPAKVDTILRKFILSGGFDVG